MAPFLIASSHVYSFVRRHMLSLLETIAKHADFHHAHQKGKTPRNKANGRLIEAGGSLCANDPATKKAAREPTTDQLLEM
ncbi:hypothetical protein ACJ73_01218 [Blastomyces percursus]|uniref:Uncharacterized protein n=1 Tax=Blastomyces percursus TaxID=1658174 RepID=A0A1J9RIE0_9EURO|nr:hypothetical protein ACJ73_01218 [Blastomyces percursus]